MRWAFALKGIACEYQAVSLLDGESESDAHRARNPLGFVPVLEFLDEEDPARRYLTESLAMIEWAEEMKPSPSLFPKDAYLRAQARALAETVNAGTQPLQNLNTQYKHSNDTDEQKQWAQYWIRNGLSAYETLAKPHAGKFSVGDELTVADLCLIPQCYNALRNEIALENYPTIHRIYQNALLTPSYASSEPEKFKPTT